MACEGGKGICYKWKEKGPCSKGDKCSFRHESNDRTKPTPKNVFAVGALVTSELTAEHRPQIDGRTSQICTLKENVLEIERMASEKHHDTCHWGRLIWGLFEVPSNHGDTVEDDVVVDEPAENATGIMPPLPRAPWFKKTRMHCGRISKHCHGNDCRVGEEQSDIFAASGSLGTESTEVCIWCKRLPVSELPCLCVRSWVCTANSCQLQLSSMTSPVREQVDLTKFQTKSLRMASPTLKSGGLMRWS